MAENFDRTDLESPLCTENDDNVLDGNAVDEIGTSPFWHNQDHNQESIFNRNGSESFLGFIVQSEESLREMVQKEIELVPKGDYLQRLRSGELDMSFRREGIDWICKAIAHHNFGPLSFCLCMNYFDRFLSLHELPRGRAWAVQLLSVACLSLAAKMEEPQVPLCVDLQVGEPKFVFEGNSILRMELLVLSTLKWRMQAVTPCIFIEYFLSKIIDNQQISKSCISTSVRVIQDIIKGIDFLEFKPSEIAAAVAISVSREVQAVDIDKAMNCFIHVEKERVMKCVELIKDLSLISGSTTGNVVSASVSQTPNGVLDLSLKSDDITVGSCPNTSQISADIKKGRKQQQDMLKPIQDQQQHKS